MRTRGLGVLKGGNNYWMAVVFFLMMVPPGMWVPNLSNILDATIGELASEWVLPAAFAIGPIVGIFSSLIFSSLADRKMEAQNLLGILSLAGALFLWLAFSSLKWGWNPWFYLGFQAANMLISTPMFALITKIMLVNLDHPERKFPIYSVFGTMGWMSSGFVVSALALNASPETGCIGAYVRLFMGVLCFLLPVTPPVKSDKKGWKVALGFEAFSLFKERSVAVFFTISALLCIPYAAFYPYASKLLTFLGSETQAAHMSLAQVLEIVAILLLSIIGAKMKMRWLLIISISFGVLRFLFFALSAEQQMLGLALLGISLHGPIYAFMSITGRMFVDKRVDPSMRGQAQALYGILTNSIGGFLGALACGWLFKATVAKNVNLWPYFWYVLCAFTFVCLILFLIGFKPRDLVKQTQDGSTTEGER